MTATPTTTSDTASTSTSTATTTTTTITFIGAGTLLSLHHELIITLIRDIYPVIMKYLSRYYEIILSL